MSVKSTSLTGTSSDLPPTAPEVNGEQFYAFPLTPSQRAMWPRGLTTIGDPRFNGAFRMNLAGAVDAHLLERSFREIAQHQETLRTAFRVAGAEVQQIVYPTSDLVVDVVDLTSFAEPDRNKLLDEISTHEAQQAFDLAQGPPVRIKLLRLQDTHSVLTITVHQIICDGWSIGLLMEELAAVYSAFATQQPSPLVPLIFEYGDYVTWQQENPAWSEAKSQLQYWQRKLNRCPQVAVSPDLPGMAGTAEAGIVSELLPRELTDRLRLFSQAENTTFYVVTMAACMALLTRYTGLEDIALRTPLAGRNRVEFEPIIGQFVNHVVVRTSVQRDLAFTELVAQLQESVWEAMANQDAPFEDVLQNIAGPGRPTDDLFRINFVCQREYGRNGPSNFGLHTAKMTTLPSKSQGALYDLNFFLVEREIGWRLSLEYRVGLYTEGTAKSLLLHFQEILHQVVEDSGRKLVQLALTPTEALTKRMQEDPTLSIPEGFGSEQESAPSDLLAMPGSLAQERFWTLSQLDPSNPSFHVPLAMKLSGPVSPQILQKALQLLVDRHESMRTTFSDQNGEFLQIIHPTYPVLLEEVAISGTGTAEKSQHLASAIQAEIVKPFNLTRLPLFRSVLCKLGEEDHVLVVTLHHILADAASAQIIQRELWATYEGLKLQAKVSLPALAIQYGDFSVWQRENLGSEAMKEHLKYWLGQLSGDLSILDFPTDRAPVYRPTSRGEVQTLLLPEKLTTAIKQLAQSNEVTLYVVTLACFAAMLSRATGSDDLIVGSPVLNRRPETEALIGPFAGPMALRLKLKDTPTLRDLILATRDRTLEGLDHAELPFELILRNLTLRAQNERRPLFQFYFLCQTAFVQSLQAGGLNIAPLPSVSMGTPFEMQLAIIERAEGLRAELEYNADLFDQSTAERWLSYYEQLLNVAVADPDIKLTSLPEPPFRSSPSRTAQKDSKQQAAQKSGPVPYVAPRDLVEEMVAQVWEGVLGIPSISVHANFFDLGGTSLLILKMVPRINAAFDLVLPVPTIFNAPTIEQMANVLRTRHTIEKQVVLPLHPVGNRPPLFMIHSYHLYRALPAALGNDQPFYGVMELELADRHAPYTLRDQVENYVQHIRDVQPKGPYYIAGFCFFGLLAFEVGAQLEALGEKVAFIGLIDAYCPDYWSTRFSATHEHFHGRSRSRPRSAAPIWHHLRKSRDMGLKDQFVSHAKFIASKFRNQGLSLVLETRVAIYTYFISRRIALPSWLKDPALVTRVGVRRHVPAKIASNIYLFPAEDVPLGADFDPTLGWGVMTTGQVKTLWIPGDHEDMFKEKNIGALAKTIRETLDLARSTSGPSSTQASPAKPSK